jgi:uncharacterized protein (TIGR04255 family)
MPSGRNLLRSKTCNLRIRRLTLASHAASTSRVQIFPLLQIGPGIFAANDGTEYEWSSFKAMALEGASAVIKDYRPLKDFAFNLQQFELRYLDTFDEKLLGTADLTTFINEGTTARLSAPKLADGAELNKPVQGRVILHREIGTPDRAIFTVDIASAKRDDTPVIRMETKVVSGGQNVPAAKGGKDFDKKLSQWLDGAHAVTSAAFGNVPEDVAKRRRYFKRFQIPTITDLGLAVGTIVLDFAINGAILAISYLEGWFLGAKFAAGV